MNYCTYRYPSLQMQKSMHLHSIFVCAPIVIFNGFLNSDVIDLEMLLDVRIFSFDHLQKLDI